MRTAPNFARSFDRRLRERRVLVGLLASLLLLGGAFLVHYAALAAVRTATTAPEPTGYTPEPLSGGSQTQTYYTLTVVPGTGGVVVSTNVGGINCPVSCSVSYLPGTTVNLAANPSANYAFVNWAGSCAGNGSCTITMNGNRSVGAVFAPLYTLTTNIGGSGMVTSSPAGVNCVTTCASQFVSGTAVTLTATPDQGYSFGGWGGACSGTAGCTVTMNGDTSVAATFNPQLQLTNAQPGVVDVSGIQCIGDCTTAYTAGTAVTLTATPDTGNNFWGWLGDCQSAGTGPCTLTMNAPHLVSAWFGDSAATPLLLSVSLPFGGLVAPGVVTSNPVGISCQNDTFHSNFGCFGLFPQGSSVSLTGSPTSITPHQYFVSWSGGASACGANPFNCIVTMDTTKVVGGSFAPIPQRVISVNLPAAGLVAPGVVTSAPSGIRCYNDSFFGLIGCMAAYDAFNTSAYPYPTTVVTLTASPTSGYYFSGWTGDCSAFGTNANCVLTMDTDRYTGGSFPQQSKLVLNVHRNPSFPGGSVIPDNPTGQNCSATTNTDTQCIYAYNVNSSNITVTLTALPESGITWYWANYCQPAGSAATCSFAIGGGLTQTVDIYFLPNLVINVHNAGGSGAATISPLGNPAITSCHSDGTCLLAYDAITTVTLGASPDSNGMTWSWGSSCGGTNPTCTITMTPGITGTVDLYFYASQGAMNKALTNTSTSTSSTNTNTTTTTKKTLL